jgi:hypothetical protein
MNRLGSYTQPDYPLHCEISSSEYPLHCLQEPAAEPCPGQTNPVQTAGYVILYIFALETKYTSRAP